ncbi:hypothetical protein M426DRAFT_7355 [Hypoxylon sp. CI-4A]|nr:hypothetical protein M426DRAFT_7355 [Hypoxylon sp. CI-4A]
MRFSNPFQSSPHSHLSPDGERIAILLPSGIIIRDTKSLHVIRTIQVSPDLTTGVTCFTWSPSSTRILVATLEQVHVFSAKDGDFHGIARIPSSAAKSTLVNFGATDDEVCIWSPFGIKLTLINFANSQAVEIANPKFYNNAASTAKGYSFRPNTHHFALLTRSSGKDLISIHSPETRGIDRSWYPDTIDAQGLAWTADGRWLVVWESPAQFPRVIFYTSDGHTFKDWRGPLLLASQDMGLQYGAGVRIVTLSPDSRLAAIANASTCICILNMPSMVEAMRLIHPQVIQPKDTLQIWQEQSTLSNTRSSSSPGFVRAAQAVTPQWTASNGLQEPTSGCNLARFDCSSTLLATRLEDAPGTIWIWDISSSDLRAVLMYHNNVTKLEWHPAQPELLLVRCEGEGYASLVSVWDPLSNGPNSIDIAHRSPGSLSGKTHATWLNTVTESAALLFTDDATGMIVSLADLDEDDFVWRDQSAPTSLPSDESQKSMQPPPRVASPSDDVDDSILFDVDDDDTSEPDDTFQFKKFVGR